METPLDRVLLTCDASRIYPLAQEHAKYHDARFRHALSLCPETTLRGMLLPRSGAWNKSIYKIVVQTLSLETFRQLFETIPALRYPKILIVMALQAQREDLAIFLLDHISMRNSSFLLDVARRYDQTRFFVAYLKHAHESDVDQALQTLIGEWQHELLETLFDELDMSQYCHLLPVNHLMMLWLRLENGVMIKKLIDACPNVVEHGDWLLYTRSPSIMILLLENGANPDVQNASGNTLLMELVPRILPAPISSYRRFTHRVVRHDEMIVDLLLDMGANPNIPNHQGKTPLMVVRNARIAKMLLDTGANVHAQDDHGHTPLFYAVQSGRLVIVMMLLDNNANPLLQNRDGVSPYQYAVEHGMINEVRAMLPYLPTL